MRLAICGPGRAGKDTAALWLEKHTILRYAGSTSEAAAQLCFAKLRDAHVYTSVAEAFADRHNHRLDWARIIWEHNQPDGITLYQEMLNTSDILNGIRRSAEIVALQNRHLVDLTVWIDRDVTPDPSCEMTIDDADVVIRNYSTPGRLFCHLERFARALGIYRTPAC